MKIAIRADASIETGSGHVMRCLALAEALRDRGGKIGFVSRERKGNLSDLVEARGFRVARIPETPDDGWEHDASLTLSALKDWGMVEWLIVDHYGIDARWESKLRNSAKRIMVIDDLADRVHDCDLLLDQNLQGVTEDRYKDLVPPQCTRLLGPKYALLRPEFARIRETLRMRDGKVRRILVFFGGSDPSNETAKALEAIQLLDRPDIAIDLVVGSSNPHRDEVKQICAALPNAAFHCQVGNMAELMAEADISVGAGGSAMWERCALGLPTLVVCVAENQLSGSTAMAEKGCILYLGKSSEVNAALLRSALEVACASPHLLINMGRANDQLADGRGANRIADRLVQKPIALREATQKDCDSLYHWRNDEESRRFSSNPDPILYENHVEWYKNAMNDPDRLILIGETDHAPAGVVRFDREDSRAVISVYLVPGKMGKGLGTRLIEEGVRWIEGRWPVKTIDALIDTRNHASIAAFEKAGFLERHRIYSKTVRA